MAIGKTFKVLKRLGQGKYSGALEVGLKFEKYAPTNGPMRDLGERLFWSGQYKVERGSLVVNGQHLDVIYREYMENGDPMSFFRKVGAKEMEEFSPVHYDVYLRAVEENVPDSRAYQKYLKRNEDMMGKMNVTQREVDDALKEGAEGLEKLAAKNEVFRSYASRLSEFMTVRNIKNVAVIGGIIAIPATIYSFLAEYADANSGCFRYIKDGRGNDESICKVKQVSCCSKNTDSQKFCEADLAVFDGNPCAVKPPAADDCCMGLCTAKFVENTEKSKYSYICRKQSISEAFLEMVAKGGTYVFGSLGRVLLGYILALLAGVGAYLAIFYAMQHFRAAKTITYLVSVCGGVAAGILTKKIA
jgi:hypothetical protein